MAKRKKKTKKKVVKKAVMKIVKTWDDGDNPIGLNLISPMSYERYMKQGLEIISKHLSMRTYKLAPKDEYPTFERGKDLRVQIWWDKNYLNYEFIIEQPFWLQSNRNKEDRKYMRHCANVHLKKVHDSWMTSKAKAEKSKSKSKGKKKVKI